MDARNFNNIGVDVASSESNGKRKIPKKEKKESHVYIGIDINNLKCPITLSVFTKPVILTPCEHMLEYDVIVNLNDTLKFDKCPCCRANIELAKEPPKFFSELLEQALTARPALYSECYFSPEMLADVLKNKALKTPTGQKLVRLLQHAKNHLNDPAIEGLYKDKSAVEILASHLEGRELLRKDKKIRELLTAESLQLQVNGKTIDEWIKIEKEEPEVALPVTSSLGMFASSSSSSSRVPAPIVAAINPAPADTIWQRAVYGNEEGALALLRTNPAFITQKDTVTNYSGRIIDNATPYQAAIREGDDVMAFKMKNIYLDSAPDPQTRLAREAELDAQFNEVFPNGYERHLQEQQASVAAFERDYLNPLVDTITNASIADIEAALRKENLVENPSNHSELFRQLNRCRAAYHALALNDKVYNPWHLSKAFEKRDAKFNEWYVNSDNPHRWKRLDLFWRQVIGWKQRDWPTNYGQAAATGFGNIANNPHSLQRTLQVQNEGTGRRMLLFPLDDALGSDVGVYSYYTASQAAAGGGGRRLAPGLLQNLCRAKTTTLGNLRSADRIAASRLGV